MKIYTKTGDKGQTSLLGGARVAKSHIRIDAYGTVDELNSYLGLIRDLEANKIREGDLIKIQETLFAIGSLLATEPGKSFKFVPHVTLEDILFLENKIDLMVSGLPEMRNFVLPGGHTAVSFCHIARCVCRRAERIVIALQETAPVDELIMIYLNRLSDYLFILSRQLTLETGAKEIPWKPRE
jgi:cob(I)alamin adenosyltransferase